MPQRDDARGLPDQPEGPKNPSHAKKVSCLKYTPTRKIHHPATAPDEPQTEVDECRRADNTLGDDNWRHDLCM